MNKFVIQTDFTMANDVVFAEGPSYSFTKMPIPVKIKNYPSDFMYKYGKLFGFNTKISESYFTTMQPWGCLPKCSDKGSP